MTDKKSKVFSFTVGELIEVQKVKHLPEKKYWDVEFQVDENGIDVLVLEREVRND